MKNRLKVFLAFVVLTSGVARVSAQKQMENIDRALVAVRTSDTTVYIGWRVFGNDPLNMGFNIYKDETKLNSSPVINSSNYIDTTTIDGAYSIKPTIDNLELEVSKTVSVWGQNYLTVPIHQPAEDTVDGTTYTYSPNDCSVGDLDGDGSYEIVVKWYPSNAKDNSQGGFTGKTYLDAYRLDGTRLWRINLGTNIRAGAHYSPFIVYDLDGDGKAEVACKTADGTTDGTGMIIGDEDADYRNPYGYILEGPEYLTIFNGESGAAVATTDYIPARGSVSSWGDSYGNRVDRFLAGVGYFDGKSPSLLMCRGYYTRTVLAAWDWKDHNLTQKWVFDSNNGYSTYEGQGAHSLSIGDVDNDGMDEVMYGAMAVDHDGTPMYNTQFNHGDATHLGDFIPSRPGLEFYMPSESAGSDYDGVLNPGIHVRDAGTGEVIWSAPSNGDVGRALTADITADYPGNEFWATNGMGLYNSAGTHLGPTMPGNSFAIWWDADPLREILGGGTIDKWNGTGTTLIFDCRPAGVVSNNGSKSNPSLTADLFGDWREEVIFRHNDNQHLLIFTTTELTDIKISTLMHDPVYRVAVAWQNAGYNQPPHTGFFIGDSMTTPAQPDIEVTQGEKQKLSTLVIQEAEDGICALNGFINSDSANFTGSGYFNTIDSLKSGITWKIHSDSAKYKLLWRYANGSAETMHASLYVNGLLMSILPFEPTGSWNNWSAQTFTVSGPPGTQAIRLEANQNLGLAYIDYLEAVGHNISVAGCEDEVITKISPKPEGFHAYPNPVSKVLTIACNSPQSATVNIFDFCGKFLFKKDLTKQDQTIDVTKLPVGIYFAEVTTPENTVHFRFIKL